jgi:hypothetical protein
MSRSRTERFERVAIVRRKPGTDPNHFICSEKRFLGIDQTILVWHPHPVVLTRSRIVAKEQPGKKESKKQPLMAPKEKPATPPAKQYSQRAPVTIPR